MPQHWDCSGDRERACRRGGSAHQHVPCKVDSENGKVTWIEFTLRLTFDILVPLRVHVGVVCKQPAAKQVTQ